MESRHGEGQTDKQALYQRKKSGRSRDLASRFEQMRLHGSFKCSGWLKVSNLTRQRISDGRRGIDK